MYVVTNVVISSWQRGAAKFAFSLSCIATPSNNVEAAFVSNVKLKMVRQAKLDMNLWDERSPL